MKKLSEQDEISLLREQVRDLSEMNLALRREIQQMQVTQNLLRHLSALFFFHLFPLLRSSFRHGLRKTKTRRFTRFEEVKRDGKNEKKDWKKD